MRLRARVFAIVAPCALLGACNAILSNEEGHLVIGGDDSGLGLDGSTDATSSSDGSRPSEDAPSGVETSTGDDAGRDATIASDAADGAVTDAKTIPIDASDADASGEMSDADAGGESGCSSEGGVQVDPNNCGVCGHSCLDGTCMTGHCQPVAIAMGQTTAGQLATDGTYVFWTYYVAGLPEDLRRAPVGAIATNDSDVTWTSIVPMPVSGVALSGNLVLLGWGSPASYVGSADKNGVQTALHLPAASTSTIAANANRVFYGNANLAMSALFDGGDVAAYDSGSPGFVSAIASPSAVFWVDGTSDHVWRALADGRPTLIYTGPSNDDLALAVDSNNLYIAATLAGTIVSCPLDGCSPSDAGAPIAQGVLKPTSLLADDGWLYWAALGASGQGNGTISRCHPATCAASTEQVASTLDTSYSLVADSVAIYWGTNSGTRTDGWIQRIAKPP